MKALFSSKRAQTNMPKALNLVLGLIMIAVGGLGLFGGMINFTLPELPQIIFTILITIGGLILLLDGFMGVGSMGMQIIPRSINRIIGILVFISGVVLLLPLFGIITALPVPGIALYGIISVAGVIMLLDGILGASDMASM